MDLDLLKTFLEVKNTRHFGRAAENLYLTQAAVSARVKQLEKLLGATLFTRYRNNLQLTATGERLVPHAEAMLISWERARQDVALKHEQKFILTIGGTTGLWDICLQGALAGFYENIDNLSVRAEAHNQDILVRRLMERTMDMAVMYEPAKITDLRSEQVATAELVLVSNCSHETAESALEAGYVSVDWGTSFDIHFAQTFQGIAPPVLHTNLARIALDFMRTKGGCAYLPLRMIEELIGDQLFQITDAPLIQRPIYMVYHKENRYSDIIQSLGEVLSAQATTDSNIENLPNSTPTVIRT